MNDRLRITFQRQFEIGNDIKNPEDTEEDDYEEIKRHSLRWLISEPTRKG